MQKNQLKDPGLTLSANGGMNVSGTTLSKGLPQNQVTTVSVGQLNDAGYKVIATPTSSNPYHVSIVTPSGKALTSKEATDLSNLFTASPNPNLKK